MPTNPLRVCVTFAFAVTCASAQSTLFDYDITAPLDYKETLLKTYEGVNIYDASFASPKGGRVPCYLVAPDRKGNFAGVVWQHGGGQDRQWFLSDAIALAEEGTVSILLDAPEQRADEIRGPKAQNPAVQNRDELIQVAVDIRRAYDILAARPGVDKDRVGFVGLSFGGMMGGTLSGFETRFKTYILDVAMEGFARHYRESPHPEIAKMRTGMPKRDFDALVAAVEPIDAVHYIDKATVPILFQAARYDIGVPAQHTYDFFAAAGGKKELRWYNCGHNLNDPQAAADRIAWLRKQLKIR